MLRLGQAGDGRAVGVISVFLAWERLTLRIHRVDQIRPGGLFLFRIQSYRGPPVRLADGTVIGRGDRIVELHLANRRLPALRQECGYSTWKLVHELRSDLAALGGLIARREIEPVVALHGVSLIGAAGATLGFEVRELPHTWRTAFIRYFGTGIDAVYHPAGLARLAGRVRERWPAEVWMSARRAQEL